MHSHCPEFEIQLDEIISPQDLHIQVRKQTVTQEINCNRAKLRVNYAVIEQFRNQQTKQLGTLTKNSITFKSTILSLSQQF